MKIKVDVEATPQELRSFFGLPNLEPLQDEMLEIIRKNMSTGIEGFDPATLMKPFLPEHLQSLSTLQKTFWQAMMGMSNNHDKDKQEKKEKDTP
ncbi:hypothetical protein BegalDRAFT_1132 [Beggiatoa alba B18LD]|uniref:Uncharacterized protein n=1 Tax=Beggiatoa alba B18LD TaxID=395493 RepID=I3CEJ1_9GAMM|nr:DUF6489 family protein [Beggiatoa alba]EIJ42034.1 hypothetical protein BegalDRAFT_1132 [Beggiatoa alba B18LD]